MNKDGLALKIIKDLMWAMCISGLVVGFGRFVYGLGAATQMTDLMPWGLWKVFNMVTGAALATSGFVVAAIIYILKWDKYKPVARFSILIGFLGYGSSLTALLFDIGLPHRGWHPFFMWNPHSFLFEVFWCVSIYWGVTALELLPIVTERFPFPKVTHFIHEKMLPFVVLGITLSTMHHSSLGSLFMTTPTRLHPLWFNLIMPPQFFISAMGSGLATIILLMIVFSKLYKFKPDVNVLSGLAKGSAAFLVLYFILRVGDLTYNNKWNYVFGPDFTWESKLFLVEISLQVILPVIIFLIPAARNKIGTLLLATSSAFFGLILHRINTGIIGYFRSSDSIYIPNLSEFFVCGGVLAGAGLIFLFVVERFNVFTEPDHENLDEHGHVIVDYWSKDEAKTVFLGKQTLKIILIAVVVIPVTWISFSDQATGSFQAVKQPVSNAVIGADITRSTLRLDGNLNNDYVIFTHKKHQEYIVKDYQLAEDQTCEKCHHLSLPKDNTSNCRLCHSDMGLDTPMFKPENHQSRFENAEAFNKFLAIDLSNGKENYQACAECHKDNMQGLEQYASTGFNHQAAGYEHAMHGNCLTCHRLIEEDPTKADSKGNCLYCHKPEQSVLARDNKIIQ